ncbi:SAFB-like transcription modulator isoform X2 [Eupeodes corollae]|uniref:SAFB-like transcription modulator isoform X2 n=1 Tax=Eupeodes corollae TaxID=290404 RepID=UPI0024927692|nr:SAFB-like transcription modulator isoform X2 [Eupeodes corollae]
MSDAVGKKLCELKVADLKEQLEKRELETTGSKAALSERLEKALKDEGKDPSTYVFEKDSLKQIVVKEEPIEVEDRCEEEPREDDGEDDDVIIDEVGEVDEEENHQEEDYEEEQEEEVEEVTEDTQNTDNNVIDNEESINLTIEEDEQQLLHNEAPDDKDKTLTDENTTETSKSKNKDKDDSSEEKKTKSDTKKSDSDKEKKSSSASTSGKEESSKDDKTADKQKDESAEQKSSSKSSASKDDKEKSSAQATDSSKSKTSSSSRNLWVSGLSSLTRASDLKTIFSKYGKVIGAKVVTNTRTPGTRCYGFVTMSSSVDASRCIDHLHRTELHGRIISVERTKNEIGSGNNSNTAAGAANSAGKKKEEDSKKSSPVKDAKAKAGDGADKKSITSNSASGKDDKDKPKGGAIKAGASDTENKGVDGDRNKADNALRPRRNSRSRDRRRIERPPLPPRRVSIDREERERERERLRREREKERERREREILSYQKIREERERQRLRERERELREEERRRREIRERQREEELRLAEERRKLAAERERLEREKAELLRLERERQKLEREKIELERLELKRQQMKIMATSRIEEPPKRAVKRSGDDRYPEATERKRNPGARFEAPPPPRFDASIATRVIEAIQDAREKGDKVSAQRVEEIEEWNRYEEYVKNAVKYRNYKKRCKPKKENPWFNEECAYLMDIKILALELMRKYKTPVARKFYESKRKAERLVRRRRLREYDRQVIEDTKKEFNPAEARKAVYKY